jgi:hypothetical protein
VHQEMQLFLKPYTLLMHGTARYVANGTRTQILGA